MNLQSHRLRALALVGLLACMSSAQATNIGINPRTSQAVVNPFTGQTTDVWKWVGKSSGCTAILITPQWVLSTTHCAAGVGSGYFNDYLTPGVENPLMYGQTRTRTDGSSASVCAPVTVPDDINPAQIVSTDLFLCRLSAPGGITGHGEMPSIAEAPFTSILPLHSELAARTASWGSLMLYGRAGPDLLAFIGFNGVPHNWSVITDPSGQTIPELVGGDSGGAVYSFSPLTGKPALTGITTHPLQFLTPAAVASIKRHIESFGDAPPAILTTAAHYGDITQRSAMDLPSPPKARWLAPGQVQIQWTAPNDPSVTGYQLTYGNAGTITGRLSMGATSLQTVLNTGTQTAVTTCVQPVNPRGLGNAGWVYSRYPGNKRFTTPNCSTLDLRAPSPPQVTLSAAYDSGTRMYRMGVNWTRSTDPVATATDIAYRITYPTGPARTGKVRSSGTSHTLWATSGATLCVTATAFSEASVPSTASATVCRKAE